MYNVCPPSSIVHDLDSEQSQVKHKFNQIYFNQTAFILSC